MTDKQRNMFSEILDLNWEMNRETVPSKKYELLGKFIQKKIDLKNDMGEVEYDKLMNAGTKMFAPKN